MLKICLWCVILLSCLTGCFQPVDDLYHLPEQSLEYEQLMGQVTAVRSALELSNPGVEYANIISGENSSTIQLQNLGQNEEMDTAITFFRVPGSENPMKIVIFSLNVEGNYVPSCIIEGQGTSILSVDFADINGIGKKEILINWQNNVLEVYSLDYIPQYEHTDAVSLVKNMPEATRLLSTTHNNYALTDLNRDDMMDISIVRLDIAGANSYVELLYWNEGALETHSIAPLSAGMMSLSSLRMNYVTGEVPALYVSANLVDGTRVTDIILLSQDRLSNVTLDPETGVSTQTVRDYQDIGPSDINSDGILEIPTAYPLPTYTTEDTVPAPTSFWLLEWAQYNSRGTSSHVFTTYHNVVDGWYLIIPDHWRNQISVSRDDSIVGQRTVIFSRWNEAGSAPTPFLTIYKLTGPNRYTRAALSDRFELGGDSITIYAASFMDDSWDCGLDQQDIIQSFFQIISSWS